VHESLQHEAGIVFQAFQGPCYAWAGLGTAEKVETAGLVIDAIPHSHRAFVINRSL